jgi:uncharacterized alpha/beta hydrolase family protein
MHKKIFALVIIAAFLVGTLATISNGVLNVQAQTMPTMKTYAISDSIPSLLGVGQETLLKVGITQALESAEYGWTGITITVVAPNGNTETLGPFKTDSTGSTYTLYTPDQVGTYNLTTNFPQQPMPVNTFDLERGAFIPAGTIMLASTAKSQMIVIEEAAPSYPGHG